MSDNYIEISKIDVAKRQIETAIILYFNNLDFVSIYSLSYSAKTVLEDVSKKQSIETPVDIMLKNIKKSKHKEFLKIYRDPANFFKHADRDASTLLKFHYKITDMILWEAVSLYYGLVNDLPPLFRVFNLWFAINHIDVFDESEIKKNYQKIKESTDLNDRFRFFSENIQLACKIKVD